MINLSVIVTVYNKKRYINKCVNSLINIKTTDIEIILVDDGSTDGSELLLDRFKKLDKRTKVIHKDNGGETSARLAGLKLAIGKYILFVDADDWIDEKDLDSLIKKLTNDTDVLVGTWVVHDGDTSIIEKCSIEEGCYRNGVNKKYFAANMIYCRHVRDVGINGSLNTKIFRRKLIVEMLSSFPAGVTYAEDDFVTYACMAIADNVIVSNIPFYQYVMQYDSLTHKQIPNFLCDLNKGYQYFLGRIKGNVNYKIYKEQIDLYLQRATFLGIAKYMGLERNVCMDWYKFDINILPKGAHVVIYGAGRVGKCYYHQIINNSSIHLDIWVDRQYSHYQEKGLPVYPVKMIGEYKDDYILIAIDRRDISSQVRNIIHDEYGIDYNKILCNQPINQIDMMLDFLLENKNE